MICIRCPPFILHAVCAGRIAVCQAKGRAENQIGGMGARPASWVALLLAASQPNDGMRNSSRGCVFCSKTTSPLIRGLASAHLTMHPLWLQAWKAT